MGNVTTNITRHIKEFIGTDGQRYTTLLGAKNRQSEYRVKTPIFKEDDGDGKTEVNE